MNRAYVIAAVFCTLFACAGCLFRESYLHRTLQMVAGKAN